jgi:hypothetical protein
MTAKKCKELQRIAKTEHLTTFDTSSFYCILLILLIVLILMTTT